MQSYLVGVDLIKVKKEKGFYGMHDKSNPWKTLAEATFLQ